MAILPIVKDGDPVLRARATEVPAAELKTPAFKKLLEDMLETMYAAEGVGIAAPQVGVSKRVFIAESSEGPIALINPVFTKTSWKLSGGEEGCLSIPGTYDKLKRHKVVTIAALTADGKEVTFTAEDFFARVLQHELDHLDGFLYADRVKQQKDEAAGKAAKGGAKR